MRQETKTFDIYRFMELDGKGREEARKWILSTSVMTGEIRDKIDISLYGVFPNSSLYSQFNLTHTKDDGFNIYGELDINDLFALINNEELCTGYMHMFCRCISMEGQEILRKYMQICGDTIVIPHNITNCYFLSSKLAFTKEWFEKLKDERRERVGRDGCVGIDKKLIYTLEDVIRTMFTVLCTRYMIYGYDYLRNMTDQEVEKICRENEWEFLEDGSPYVAEDCV